MATEQDTTETDAAPRPQTPAARRRNPDAEHQRTAEERERLREQSRARRRARAEGHVVAPEPGADEISVRRLPDAGASSPPPAPPAPLPAAPPPSSLKPSTPAGGAVREEETETPVQEAVHEAPAAPAPPPTSPPLTRPAAPQPAAPRPPRERATVLLALAAAVGVVVCLAASIGSGSLPGFGGDGLRAKASDRVVAPGGWLTLAGSHAPHGGTLLLESRSTGGAWHVFAQASSDSHGDFGLRGRVLERPGRIEVRARALAGGTTNPVPVTVRPLRLASVGDINLSGAPADPWRGTGRTLKSADIAFGNLESAVSTRGEPFPKEYNFRAEPAALAGLRRNSGIDVLNLANNHVGDYGPEATVDTVRGVERHGMKAVGAGPSLQRALAPQVVKRLGLKVAFVGFSEIAPIEFAAAPGHPGTAWASPDHVAAAVQAARRKADIVIATFHWGIEKQTLETARQRELADLAVRNGAQVVIGAHPHTLQPVRRQGGAIVAYSLGNFVFAAQSPETTTTGILELGLTAEGVSRADWRAARISGGLPLLDKRAPRRLPLRDNLAMEAGVNLPDL